MQPAYFTNHFPNYNVIMIFHLGKYVQEIRTMAFCYQKLFLTTVRKNCSSNGEKLLKFEAEGRECAKFLRSLE